MIQSPAPRRLPRRLPLSKEDLPVRGTLLIKLNFTLSANSTENVTLQRYSVTGLKLFETLHHGIAKAASHSLLVVETPVRVQVSPHVICGGQSDRVPSMFTLEIQGGRTMGRSAARFHRQSQPLSRVIVAERSCYVTYHA